MEALVANLLEPGETIIVGNNGAQATSFYAPDRPNGRVVPSQLTPLHEPSNVMWDPMPQRASHCSRQQRCAA